MSICLKKLNELSNGSNDLDLPFSPQKFLEKQLVDYNNIFFFTSVFGLDSPLSLFPPGMDPGKLYNPLMEMPDPRGIHGPHPHGPYLKKKNKCKYIALFTIFMPYIR